MRFAAVPTRVFSTLFLLAAAACAPAEQGEAAPAESMAAAVPESMAAAMPAGQMSCFLRGATMEEAAARPSPVGQTSFSLNGGEGLLCYGRPSANGRVVMGELVPYGTPWRLGANEATAIHLSAAATIGGVAVQPGSYSLYAVPGPGEWTFHVNTQVERWGIPINDGVMAADVGTFTVPTAATPSMVEQLTMEWVDHGEGMGHIVIDWENTRVEVPVHAAGM
jgi:hypothetical protein